MTDEIPPPPFETPEEIPATAPGHPVQAPPPAARLVVHGVKSEREIELETLLADKDEKLTATERRALEAERKSAELERDNQELKKIPTPPKPKRNHNWLSPVIGSGDED